MKQVIDGKLFNTETAERVAHDDNSLPVNDFNNWDETLYRTKNGRWFVHGRGGPLTRYAEAVGNGWTGGQEIRPLTETQARTWCEDHQINADLIARYFTIEEA
ncbi:MAG: hypothetical protein KDI77_16905 [Gammaproteobacteria bacterium]|nr:hypothetical protein [Gammaproteobacteria bacterium]MCP5429741.1 hypothetical protein [Chromatiaceae bacterium]MCP5435179.1 hypothetical protein [Chromatiaceae bacterium]